MANTIDQAFITQFETEVHLALLDQLHVSRKLVKALLIPNLETAMLQAWSLYIHV